MILDFCNEILSPLVRWWKPKYRWKAYEETDPDLDSTQDSFFPPSVLRKLSKESRLLSSFYIYLLSQIPESVLPVYLEKKLRVLDLGSMNFIYASGLARFLLSRAAEKIHLVGMEADLRKVYPSLYRREDLARYHAGVAKTLDPRIQVDVLEADWLKVPDQDFTFHWITCFFPFLFEDLHRKAGLKKSAFAPSSFYSKALKSAERVIFFHQGEEEILESKKILKSMDAEILFEKIVGENPFLLRKHPVGVMVASGDAQKRKKSERLN